MCSARRSLTAYHASRRYALPASEPVLVSAAAGGHRSAHRLRAISQSFAALSTGEHYGRLVVRIAERGDAIDSPD